MNLNLNIAALAAILTLCGCSVRSDAAVETPPAPAIEPAPENANAPTGDVDPPAAEIVVAANSEAAEIAGPVSPHPASWKVDKGKSRLEFTGVQTGKGFTGAFSSFETSIDLDPENLAAARIGIVIDMTSAKTGDRQRDAALPTAEWFSTAAFPNATFSSSEVLATGPDAYEARGKLTIRDVSKDLLLPFTLKIAGDHAVAEGAATLVRSDFGVGQGEFATGAWVALDVGVSFHLEADR